MRGLICLFATTGLFAVTVLAAEPDVVRIGVLGLFHVAEIEVGAAGRALTLSGCGEGVVLEGGRRATLRATAEGVSVAAGPKSFQCESISTGNESAFELTVPGKIRRRYRGGLQVTVADGALEVVVGMRREAALAAIVAAETDTDWPAAALEAQAVVSRSYLAAGGRHASFDFCDTTHCQYLAEAPPRDGAVRRALRATEGALLVHQGKPVEALYTRSCSGRTLSAAAAGLAPSPYRYHAVECPACSRDPLSWLRRFPIALGDAIAAVRSEAARIDFVRRHGWSALPGVSFETRREDGEVVVEGVGEGHGVGMCQRGAVEMARRGADWRTILRHFFANASLR